MQDENVPLCSEHLMSKNGIGTVETKKSQGKTYTQKDHANLK